MKRTIINIDEEKCIGCSLCINACEQGAIQLVEGKARLISDDYCDGLGKCLPKCPVDAITLEEREAAAFDREASLKRKQETSSKPFSPPASLGCGCPGTAAKAIVPKETGAVPSASFASSAPAGVGGKIDSQLRQWPVQIKLVPVHAPYLENSHLLVAADCTAFAYGEIHRDFIRNRVTLIGCPKLDEGDYADKLTAILEHNNIKSLTILRMEVPCCSGIANAAKNALIRSGKMIPWNIVTISTDGQILED